MILVVSSSSSMAEDWCREQGMALDDPSVRVLTQFATKARVLGDGDEVHFVGTPDRVPELSRWVGVLAPMGCRTITLHLRGGS